MHELKSKLAAYAIISSKTKENQELEIKDMHCTTDQRCLSNVLLSVVSQTM